MSELADLLHSCADLRLCIRTTRDDVVRDRLFRTEQRLRAHLPASTSKRVAAAVLGVSVQSLDRWLERGAVPVVQVPGTRRRRVETTPLLELLCEVTKLRDSGVHARTLSKAIEALNPALPGREIVLREEVAALPRPSPSAAELRHDFVHSTAEERLMEAMRTSRAITRLAAARDGGQRSA